MSEINLVEPSQRSPLTPDVWSEKSDAFAVVGHASNVGDVAEGFM